MNNHRRYSQIALLVIVTLLVLSVGACRVGPQTPVPLPPTRQASPVVPPDTPAPATPATVPSLPAVSTLAPSETAAPAPALPDFHPQYSLRARFDYGSHLLAVNESIRFTNPSSQPLGEILFVIEPNRYPGAFALQEIRWAGGDPITNYRLDDHNLTIPLGLPFEPGEATGLELAFTVTLPPIPEPSEFVRPAAFGYTARQSNLVDWFAYLPPYQAGQGWISHPAWFFGEHQVFPAADFEVSLEVVPAGQELVVAASALDTDPGPEYSYSLENARTFALSVSPDYRILEGEALGVKVYSYVFPFTLPAGEEALQNTIDAINLFSDLFGPYPYPSLSVVEADFLDGMEYDGLYFLSRGFYNLYDGTRLGYLTAIAVHETAHQWWYASVGNDQALEPWLDEALCTYSELLFYQHYLPDKPEWWWSFRVNYYKPEGNVGDTLYDFPGFRPYVNAVYLRGAGFLHNLRANAGEVAFFNALRSYAEDYAGKIATGKDFLAYFGEAAQQALAAYFSN